MRIADKMNYDQVTSNLGKNRTELADLQNQAALQKRVTKPSDDPLAAARVLAARTEINTSGQFIKSVDNARTLLNYADQSLGELGDALVRAKELAISQSNDASANEKSREVVATEIGQLHSQAVQIGNRKFGDRYLFGGFRTTKPPFDQNGHYYGDDGEIKITIGKEATIAMNVPGSRIFLGHSVDSGRASGGSAGSSTGSAPNYEPGSSPSSEESHAEMRGPASLRPPNTGSSLDTDESSHALENNLSESWSSKGVNVFKVLRDLETGLKTNDKGAVQDSLDHIDEAIAQVLLSRSEVGSKVSSLNSATDTLMKGQVDAKTMASNLEDADTFQLVSDINKTESTLKATLETSGKLIQPSLLDFLR